MALSSKSPLSNKECMHLPLELPVYLVYVDLPKTVMITSVKKEEWALLFKCLILVVRKIQILKFYFSSLVEQNADFSSPSSLKPHSPPPIYKHVLYV